MLILTRYPNQRILIGSDIIITVMEIRGDKVRIGIKAPRHIEVHREEIAEHIRTHGRYRDRDGDPNDETDDARPG